MSDNGYRETAGVIAQAMEDKKARDVVILDVSSMTLVTDFLVIGTGNTAIQVRAHADRRARFGTSRVHRSPTRVWPTANQAS